MRIKPQAVAYWQIAPDFPYQYDLATEILIGSEKIARMQMRRQLQLYYRMTAPAEQ